MNDSNLSWPYPRSDLAPPATRAEIAAAEAALGRTLPDDVRAFYAMANGFNGNLAPDNDGTYVRLHPLDLVLSCTSGYDVARDLGQLVLIGDNGGDFFYALDYATNPPTFVGGSFLANDRDELEPMGQSLSDFLARIAAR